MRLGLGSANAVPAMFVPTGRGPNTRRVAERDPDVAPSASLIALIEDDRDVREALASLLSDAGYRVLPYEAADHALRDMRNGRRPDLILLDLMMPGMNGWQFRVEQLRLPELAQVPVIALSADRSAQAAAIDAAAYLTKPVDADRLCTVIGQVLLAAERQGLAAKAVELERVRSLGMLVAGVAHEINNPLSYLIGNLELTLEQSRALSATPTSASELGPLLVTGAESALDGAQRIAHVVRLLSTFARAETDEARATDVLRAIDAASRLAMHQIRFRARLVCQLEPLPTVHANEAQLAQVFLNLLLNAAQATPEGAPDQYEIRIGGRTEAGKVIVEVTDKGCGIAPELTSRVFEPFFTTKAPGLGTGLGLSISRDIVNRFGGSISVSSVLGAGSTFRVELPIAKPSASNTENGSGGSMTRPAATSSQRVLVIDDEPAVGRVIAAILAEDQVEMTTNAKEGLERAAAGDFDIVLCDFLMPAMNGIELYDELCRRRPDLKSSFVLMTGAAIDDELDRFLSATDVFLLRKPFTVREIQCCAALGRRASVTLPC